jgi:hypothetical protein
MRRVGRILGMGWCMKKLGNSNSIFELLNKEEVWEWEVNTEVLSTEYSSI